jgi:hypothetical protein
LKLVRKLPFVLFFVLGVAFAHPHGARAATPTEHPEPSELVRPSSGGSDTFKLAGLGIVFLIIGAAVVYAPQIVSAVTGLPRRMSGRAPKSKTTKKAEPAATSRSIVVEEKPTSVIEFPPRESQRAPPPLPRAAERRVEIPEAHDVVSRLQNEIRSAWSKTR